MNNRWQIISFIISTSSVATGHFLHCTQDSDGSTDICCSLALTTQFLHFADSAEGHRKEEIWPGCNNHSPLVILLVLGDMQYEALLEHASAWSFVFGHGAEALEQEGHQLQRRFTSHCPERAEGDVQGQI